MRLTSNKAVLGFYCSAVLVLSASTASGQLFFGPGARTMFEGFIEDVGGHFLDFNSFSPGAAIQNQFLVSDGVSFASVTNTAGTPTSPRNIISATAAGRAGTIVGTPFTCCDDGRVGYEITFTDPQRWAGLQRLWNTGTLTRFFDSEDNLLVPEHFNTVGSEFVSYVAQTEDPAGWIARIQIDSDETRQVGYSDDLFFGTAAIPEPATGILLGLGLTILLVFRRSEST